MVTFDDGPAAGARLSLQRSPLLLRIVQNAKDQIDALDQLDDVPESDERIAVYLLVRNDGNAFIDGRDPKTGKRFGRREAMASYELYDPQPTDEQARDPKKWHDWCATQVEAVAKKRPNFGIFDEMTGKVLARKGEICE